MTIQHPPHPLFSQMITSSSASTEKAEIISYNTKLASKIQTFKSAHSDVRSSFTASFAEVELHLIPLSVAGVFRLPPICMTHGRSSPKFSTLLKPMVFRMQLPYVSLLYPKIRPADSVSSGKFGGSQQGSGSNVAWCNVYHVVRSPDFHPCLRLANL